MRKKIADIFVIIVCVAGALFFLNLFTLDLLQSIASQNRKPAGTVTARYNNVQRRPVDRLLWGRLTVESPVYPGDLIRVAESSSASLAINGDVIDLSENTMIRIRVSLDRRGRVVIDLDSGSLSVTGSGTRGGVAVNVMGRVISPTAGDTLVVSVGESGMTPQLSEIQDADNLLETPAWPEPEPIAAVTPATEPKPATPATKPKPAAPATRPITEAAPATEPIPEAAPASVTLSAPDTPQTQQPVVLPEEKSLPPPDVPARSIAFISPSSGWFAYNDKTFSRSNISIARETINGMEREVLTINIHLASGSPNNNWAGTATENMDIIQILRRANGVRFKVLGDGKKWNANFVTTDVKDTAWHITAIPTKKGEVSVIDIPLDKLYQPNWGDRAVFNKNNITIFAIERNINNGAGDGIGPSTIKVFDFEVY